MNQLISQVSYPVFLYLTFTFFLIASAFSFVVGVALAIRSQKALRTFDSLNRWISVRKMMRPLMMPHNVESTLMKRRAILGSVIFGGALISILLLAGTDLAPALSLFSNSLTEAQIAGVADNLEWFMLVGNAVCLVIGALILFSPQTLLAVENYTDRWLTLRKTMQPLERMHMEIDCWVLKHPTSVGIALTVLSLSAGMLMYNQLQNIVA